MAQQTHHRRTDDEWVAALRGDLGEKAQEAAYEDLARYLYVVVYNYLCFRSADVPGLQNKSDAQLADLAEEFNQSTLVKIALGQIYNRYRGDAKFTSYMAVVARREVGQALRHREWWVYTEPLPASESDYDPESGDTLPSLPAELIADSESDMGPQRREMWETIRRCVEQLPERWRRALVLNVFEELSATEVKERLNVPSEQAVYNLVHRARSRLKECLADSGTDPDDI